MDFSKLYVDLLKGEKSDRINGIVFDFLLIAIVVVLAIFLSSWLWILAGVLIIIQAYNIRRINVLQKRIERAENEAGQEE